MKFKDTVLNCTLCSELSSFRNQPVIGEGPIPSPIVLLGEAPGKREDETGLPFQGVSGDLLRALLHRCGLQQGDYHILNVLKCRPPENRDPHPDEIKNCRPFLQYQIKRVNPRIIVGLGKFGQAHLLQLPPSKVFVVNNAGKMINLKNSKRKGLLTFHPAFVARKRNTDIERAFIKHLKLARKISRSKEHAL
jgi:uracil-DNA glycosylase family 4